MSKEDGWWQVYYAPEMRDGVWSIMERDTRDGSEQFHKYSTEAEAQEAYQGLFQMMLSKKLKS